MARGRPYCKVSPRIHTGTFGRSIRGESLGQLRAQSLAGYLASCPHGNAIGLFFLPLGYLMADRGWSENGASDALSLLEKRGLIRYVSGTEWCWVIEAFRHEFGADPARSDGDGKKEDSRRPLIHSLLREAEGSGLLAAFLDHHGPAYPYLLQGFTRRCDAPSDGAYNGASDGGKTGGATGLAHAGAQDQDQDQDQEAEQENPEGPPLFPIRDGKPREVTDEERAALEVDLAAMDLSADLLDPWLAEASACANGQGHCVVADGRLLGKLRAKLRHKPPKTTAETVDAGEWALNWMLRIRGADPQPGWNGSDRGWFAGMLSRYEADGAGIAGLDRDLAVIADRYPEKPSTYWTQVIRGAEAKGKLGDLEGHLDRPRRKKPRQQPHGVNRPPIVYEEAP